MSTLDELAGAFVAAGKELLAPGDKVTFLGADGRTRTGFRRTTGGVTAYRTQHMFGVLVGGTTWSLDTREEGLLWIRGHHAAESPEVRALTAAYLLARE